MKQTMTWGAVAITLLAPLAANAQTVVNNITINNGGNGGNGFGGRGDTGQAVNWRNDSRRLEAWLYTDRTNYRPGSGVQLRITLTNNANTGASMPLPRQGEYAITITDTRTNRVIWSRNRTQARGQSLQLNAGGTAQWTEFWDQRDSAGNVVPMGAYRIDVRVVDLLPLSAQVFLTDRVSDRPQPGNGNGNGNGGIVPPDPVTGPPPTHGGIGNGNGNGRDQFLFSAIRGNLVLSKNTVRPGDVVRFAYTVVNTSAQPITLTFGSSQLFDVWATAITRTPAGARTPVWRLGDGVAWAQMMQQVTLPGGGQRVFQGSWRIGSELAPGQSLNVSASLTPTGGARGTVGAAQTRVDVN